MNAWVVVDLLEEVHLDEDVRIDCEVSPVDVPIARLVTILDLPVQRLCDLGDYGILGHWVRERYSRY